MPKGKLTFIIVYLIFVLLLPVAGLLFFNKGQNSEIPKSLIPQVADAFSRDYITILKQGDIQKAFSLVQSNAAENGISQDLLQKASLFLASSTISSMQIIGTQTQTFNIDNKTTTTYHLSYEFRNNDTDVKFILATVALTDDGSGLQVTGIIVTPEKRSIKDQGGFNFNKQAVPLALSLLLPLFIAYTAFRYIKKAKKANWIMLLVIILGSVYVSVAPGSTNINIGLFGFMSKGGLWGPIVFLYPVPIGAIIYYFSRKKFEV